jgi:hypothetical protein
MSQPGKEAELKPGIVIEWESPITIVVRRQRIEGDWETGPYGKWYPRIP